MKKILTLTTVIAALFLAACAEKKEEVPADSEAMVKATEDASKDVAKETEAAAAEAEKAAGEMKHEH